MQEGRAGHRAVPLRHPDQAGTSAAHGELLAMKSRLSELSTRQMPNDDAGPQCERATRHLWEYVDRELPLASLRAIGAHLAACRECRARMNTARGLLRAVAASGDSVRAPFSLRARVTAYCQAERVS